MDLGEHNNRKARLETFKCWDLESLILEIWRYLIHCWRGGMDEQSQPTKTKDVITYPWFMSDKSC